MVVGLSLCAALSAAQEIEKTNKYYVAGIRDDAKVASFLRQLQDAVRSGDRNRVAGMMKYPLWINGKKGELARTMSRKEFIAEYANVVTPRIRAVILTQKLRDLFYNQEGFWIGHDDVWFGAVDDHDNIRVLQISPSK